MLLKSNHPMKSFFCFFCGCLLLFSCNYKEQKYPRYSFHEQGYYYKLASFSEKNSVISVNDYVTATAYFFVNQGDSLLASEHFRIQVQPSSDICFSQLLLNLRNGDSAQFITPNYACVRNVLLPEYSELLANHSNLYITVKVHLVQNQQEFEQQQQQYQLWLTNKRDFELQTIEAYVKNHSYQFQKNSVGFFSFPISRGSGITPQFGDLVTISYQGSLLNGDIINHFTTLEYVYGTQWQVIDGIDKMLATMVAGDRVLCIIPSEFAWGEHGSTNQLIQPFTPIVFDLELVSVQKTENEM